MKLFNKQILEAIQRGINLAIDDFDGFDNAQDIETQKVGQIENKFSTKEQLELRKYFVDLGLPSGTLWGKYNIGADCDDYAESWYGDYFAWGEVEPKKEYTWNTYKYGNDFNCLLKYCYKASYWTGNGKPDRLTKLEDKDNVVVQINRTPWNLTMPTKEQIVELCNENYVIDEYVANYNRIEGLNGRLFTSKINGNQMFIPAAGMYLNGSSVSGIGTHCEIWSLDLYDNGPDLAYYLYFYIDKHAVLAKSQRCYGFNVRPVINT